MAIYRDLFFNNISQFLAGTFPVLHKILDAGQWRSMMRDFYAHHRSRSPYFLDIPREFLDYLQDERGPRPADPPFLLELAHYEWVELALSVDTAEPDLAEVDPAGDLLRGIPVLSPLAWRLSYRFPVQRISPQFQPMEPLEQPVHLVVCRNLQDELHFTEVNVFTARLLELMEEAAERSGEQLLRQIASEIGAADAETIVQAGAEMLVRLRQSDIVLGTRRDA